MNRDTVPSAYPLHVPIQQDAIDLTHIPPTSHPPHLVEQQPRAIFGDTTHLLHNSPSITSTVVPLSSSPSPFSSDTECGRSNQCYNCHTSKEASRNNSSGSWKRKLMPDTYIPDQEETSTLADELSMSSPSIPLQTMSELSISSPQQVDPHQGESIG